MAAVEGIDIENVTAWVAERIDGLQPPLEFTLIAGGHSNLTYKFVDRRGEAYVLRRPPLGHILESAHDMGREHRIVSALWGTDVPVAETFGLCEDKDVNGLPFYLMKFVEGVVPHDAEATATIPESERRSAGAPRVGGVATRHRNYNPPRGLGVGAGPPNPAKK
ncbi:MAG: phosphotransferase family protein, partial [Gammaproteobacteria bacterium]|nr:phosphotransferase family protein [Gammaproteobacteria bacterium]